MDLPSSSSSRSSSPRPLAHQYEPSQPLYDAILQIIANEIAAPELLPYNDVVDQLVNFAQTLLTRMQLEQFRAQRILQLCAIYTSERLKKIEGTALFRNEDLSSGEREFAKQVGKAQLDVQRRVLQGLQEKVGVDFQEYLVDDVKRAIILHKERCDQRKVFAVFSENVQLGEMMWHAGDCGLLEYGIVRGTIIDGKAVIYGFTD